ncbi:MAG: anti-sigma factor [Acidobacteria bacterium]|jgi:anti-sigma factor RsiW|nr:anti-sigma factor [Acidobacteriota bacterium]
MNCFPELTYAVYADGELPAEEAAQVEEHLAACSRCRRLADSLQVETRALQQALQADEAAEPSASRQNPPQSA